MGSMFADTMQGLLEAVEIKNGNLPVTAKDNMPAPTFAASDISDNLIDQVAEIRKRENISQSKLADMTGSQQQAISRFEKKQNNPSLCFFLSIVDALGYELKLVNKQ